MSKITIEQEAGPAKSIDQCCPMRELWVRQRSHNAGPLRMVIWMTRVTPVRAASPEASLFE